MEITIEKINERNDPYQLFSDSIKNKETARRYKNLLYTFLKLIPNQAFQDVLGKTPKHIQDSDVFIDQLKPKGVYWRKENDQKLIDSDIVIIALTNGALESTEVKREVNIAKDNPERIIVPCKDDLLKMDWHEMPYTLGELDEMNLNHKRSFDNMENVFVFTVSYN